MFCCADFCGVDTTISERETLTSFPGHRRFVRTGGNALRDYDAAIDANPPTNAALFLVQVPPGINAGETLHVQIPGEDRILAVQVPTGVSEFHVSYEPNNLMPPPTFTTSSLTTNDRASPPYRSSDAPSSSCQNLVLVQVPHGIDPGSFIQVQVPGQDRFIMAQVPAGVHEFYVSIDTTPCRLQSNDAVSKTIKNGVVNTGNSNNSNHQDENSFGIVAPIVAGAALMGAAGYMLSHHGESDDVCSNDDW